MVSMLDYTRFILTEAAVDTPMRQQQLYDKHRDVDVFKQAEKSGYFMIPSRKFLEQSFAPGSTISETSGEIRNQHDEYRMGLPQIYLINLSKWHLQNVGDIGVCSNMTICVLSGNYIRHIDGLITCNNLIKLDLSHNQIAVVPAANFWLGFHRLRFLHLHDNLLSKFDVITSISYTNQITILTMYDTPISLKKNYRHHVVNSIWTLKALDHHIISDQEIIEDAHFRGRFVPFHSALKVNLCPVVPQDASYEEHSTVLKNLLRSVNKIMSHNSPVLIAQKVIRGFLVRRWVRAKDLAARYIEQSLRNWKKDSLESRTIRRIKAPKTPKTGGPSRKTSQLNLSRQTTMSTMSDEAVYAAHIASSIATHIQENTLDIDLNKLKACSLNTVEIHSKTAQTYSSSVSRETRETQGIKKAYVYHGKQQASPEHVFEDDEDDMELINFRLCGWQKKIQEIDRSAEIIFGRVEAAKDVRNAEFLHHLNLENQEKPHVQRKTLDELSSIRKNISRHKTSMGFSCLRAVCNAYKDREKVEQKSIRAEHVFYKKDQREFAQKQINIYHKEKRRQVLKSRVIEGRFIMEKSERRNKEKSIYLEKTGEIRSKSAELLKQRRNELMFISDFSAQNTSVSNALMRHDLQAAHEDKHQEMSEVVSAQKGVKKEQQALVNKFLEHRTLMRQTEVAMTKAEMDGKILQEANDRLVEAQCRVEQQKIRTPNTKSASLPKISTPSFISHDNSSTPGLVKTNSESEIIIKLFGSRPTTVA